MTEAKPGDIISYYGEVHFLPKGGAIRNHRRVGTFKRYITKGKKKGALEVLHGGKYGDPLKVVVQPEQVIKIERSA